MYKITKQEWDKIPNDFKGKWDEDVVNYLDLDKSYIGKKTILEGCLTNTPKTNVLTEDIHFIIV